MVNENSNTETFDEAGFEAFFKTHPNDATVSEDVPPTEDTSETGTTPEEDTGATNEDTADESTENGSEEGNTPPPADTNKNNQQAHAFAQMRATNRQQQNLINSIANVVGVKDVKDPNAVMQALQNLVVKAQSQKQGIPEEFLQRLTTLEATNQEYQRQQAYLAAGRGFQTIKDKFQVDDAGLESFAQELIGEGLNPYEQPMDLVAEYRNRHFDELIAKAVQQGITQEAQRAAKAGTQGSTPNLSQGSKDDDEPRKINSIKDLNKWLDENK